MFNASEIECFAKGVVFPGSIRMLNSFYRAFDDSSLWLLYQSKC